MIKIKKIEYDTDIGVIVTLEERNYKPCFELETIIDKADFINKLKAELQEIDNLTPVPVPPPPAMFVTLKALEGTDI